MMGFRVKHTAIILFMVGLVAAPLAMHAQENLSYRGPLKVGKYNGDANYSYKVVDEDTLLDGKFQIQRSNLEALLKKEDASFLFKGTFKDDYANGYWRFQFGEFESDSESEVVDYQYRVAISGVQEEADGSILAGKPDGEWTYTVNRIQDSDIAETLFKSNITFENGVPQKSFRIENEKSTLVGRFLRNGLAHDEWSLYTNDGVGASENWSFIDGVLRNIQIQKEGNTRTLPVFDRGIGLTKIINLDARYIKALQMQRSQKDTTDTFHKGMPAMLAENASYYDKIDAILSELGKSAFLPEFKVKVPYFPLDSTETVQMDSINTYFRESKAVSDSLLNNSQLNILKLSDTESSFLYAIINRISKDFLAPLQTLVGYSEDGILEYVERDQLLSGLWPEVKPSVEIIPYNETDSLNTGRTFVLPDAAQFDFSGNSMSTVRELAHYAALSLDSIQKVLDQKLTTEQRQQELISYEEQLIAQIKRLDTLIDSVDKTAPKTNKEALEAIKRNADKQLSDYSSLKENDGKLARARELSSCFAQMDTLAKTTAALPDQWQEIQDLYLDAVWNPFMANVMNEEVKKRITTAYRKVLVPYFLERITDDLGCENIDELVTQMQQVYGLMLKLRNENTSKLERKLRRERDAQEVIRLLNRPTPTKEN